MWRAVERLRRLPLLPEEKEKHARGEATWIASAKLKLVDGCNLRCFMCDYWKRHREVELTTKEVVSVLEDLKGLSCEKIHFTGGEIFLREDALLLLAKTRELGMRVNLTTNGTLLDEERLRALLDVPPTSVTVSVDSPLPDLHDELRGQKGAFKKTTKTIDRLLRWRPRKTRVRVNTVVSARSMDSLLAMPEWLEERPVDQWLLIPIDPKPGDTALGLDRVKHWNARIAPVLEARVRVPGFSPWIFGRSDDEQERAARGEYALGKYRERACHVPWFHTLVDACGDVYPCCMGHRALPPLGNVREKPLREIWNDAPYVAFRRAMRVARTEVCHRCDDFSAENAAIDALAEGRPVS